MGVQPLPIVFLLQKFVSRQTHTSSIQFRRSDIQELINVTLQTVIILFVFVLVRKLIHHVFASGLFRQVTSNNHILVHTVNLFQRFLPDCIRRVLARIIGLTYYSFRNFDCVLERIFIRYKTRILNCWILVFCIVVTWPRFQIFSYNAYHFRRSLIT